MLRKFFKCNFCLKSCEKLILKIFCENTPSCGFYGVTFYRERERETDRQTDRQRQTDRDRQTETDRQTERDRQTEGDREKVR